VAATYAPSQSDLVGIAERAQLTNTHPDARGWLLEKLRTPPHDWESRTAHTVPGVVWTVESDTCMTGRPNGPRNIAYDNLGREFVYRQPRDEGELVGIMSADSEEVFSCYRFDGLERWTIPAVDAWFDTTRELLVGWVRYQLSAETESAILDGLIEAHDYLISDPFRDYVVGFRELLSRRTEAVDETLRR
jgi:hypothetical protein